MLTGRLRLQVGMRYFNKRTNKYFNPIINLDKLWTLVGEEVCPDAAQYASNRRGWGADSCGMPLLCGGAALRIVHGWVLRATYRHTNSSGTSHVARILQRIQFQAICFMHDAGSGDSS